MIGVAESASGVSRIENGPTLAEQAALLARAHVGRCREVLRIFLSRGHVELVEFEPLYAANDWEYCPKRLRAIISSVRIDMRGSGWTIVKLRADDLYGLAKGELVKREPGACHKEQPKPVRLRPQTPEDKCRYIVIRDGKASDCGAPCAGVYCEEHRAKSAGIPYRGPSRAPSSRRQGKSS